MEVRGGYSPARVLCPVMTGSVGHLHRRYLAGGLVEVSERGVAWRKRVDCLTAAPPSFASQTY